MYIYLTVASASLRSPMPLRVIEHRYTPLRVSARDSRCARAASFWAVADVAFAARACGARSTRLRRLCFRTVAHSSCLRRSRDSRVPQI